jgi:branched-subunit amino acid transport protein
VTTSYDPATIWLVLLAAGLGTFAIRLSFIALLGRVDEIPRRVRLVLAYVPAAVLAALVAPSLATLDGTVVVGLGNERLLAGAVAAVVAWRTENVLATIAVGMAALWAIQFLL